MTNLIRRLIVAVVLVPVYVLLACAQKEEAYDQGMVLEQEEDTYDQGTVLEQEEDTYDQETVLDAATNFFGETTEGVATVIEKIFEEQGQPNAYIAGDEISGAFWAGLRYGKGTLHRKNGGTLKVYWQGPSIGWDVGGNASKVFVLVYHLKHGEEIFKRFPGVDGSFYFVAGVGVNYQQNGDVVLAPIRTGVGLRAGANVGYLHYTRKHSWLPF